MVTSVVVKPTTEPVSLAEARAHLRLDTTDTDPMLVGYLIAARQFVTDYTRRLLLTQTWDCTFDWEWPYLNDGARDRKVRTSYRLDLPYAPVASISQVTYIDLDNNTQTLSPTQYLLRGAGPEGIPYIIPANGVTWPSVLEVPETIRVRFVGGYGSNSGDVPEGIRNAILLHTELLYDRNPENRELLEASRNAMLDPYRLVRL